ANSSAALSACVPAFLFLFDTMPPLPERSVHGALAIPIRSQVHPPASRRYPLYRRDDTPVRVKLEPAESRRHVVQGKVALARLELDARRWRSEKPHAVALTAELLVDMPPDHAPYLRKAVDQRKKLLAIIDADRIDPVALHGNGMVMQ